MQLPCNEKTCPNWEQNRAGVGVCVYDTDTITSLTGGICKTADVWFLLRKEKDDAD